MCSNFEMRDCFSEIRKVVKQCHCVFKISQTKGKKKKKKERKKEKYHSFEDVLIVLKICLLKLKKK